MQVRLYRPARNAMQSGQANSKRWILEFEPAQAKKADPLMGWIGSGDMDAQVRLKFASKEDALAYAKRMGLDIQIDEPKERAHIVKNYADIFRFDRVAS
jgi:hypothetical protein